MYERAVYELEGKGTVYQKVKEKLSRILFPVLPTHTLLLAAILGIVRSCHVKSWTFYGLYAHEYIDGCGMFLYTYGGHCGVPCMYIYMYKSHCHGNRCINIAAIDSTDKQQAFHTGCFES